LMVLVFLTWGELYVLFPAVLGDMYGSKNSAGNYSFLYSAKGLASLVGGGIAAVLFEKTGTWNYAFFGSAALALVSALMALGVRRMPLPQKTLERALSIQPSMAKASQTGPGA
jgi:MFS transporter, OFA family, oxalate/formate antiporter